MTRRLLPILALLCGARGTPAAAQQVVLQFRPVGSVFGAGGGTAPVRPGSLARERKVTAKFVELDERTRTAKLVQWVPVENPQSPGTIPVEVSDLLNQWRQRVAELRRGPLNLQVVALINRYESQARTLQKIREQSFQVVISPQARLYCPTRESLTALTLNTRVQAIGVGTNLNARNEPTLLTLTADLVELSVPPPPRFPPPPASTGGEAKGTPNPTARILAQIDGTLVSLRPLVLRTESGTLVGLTLPPASNVGFQRLVPIALTDLKAGDWAELDVTPVPGGWAVQELRLTSTSPLGPVAGTTVP